MVAMTWIDIGMQYKNFFVDHSFYHHDNKNHNAICSCWDGSIYWIAAYPEFEYMMYELFMDKVL